MDLPKVPGSLSETQASKGGERLDSWLQTADIPHVDPRFVSRRFIGGANYSSLFETPGVFRPPSAMSPPRASGLAPSDERFALLSAGSAGLTSPQQHSRVVHNRFGGGGGGGGNNHSSSAPPPAAGSFSPKRPPRHSSSNASPPTSLHATGSARTHSHNHHNHRDSTPSRGPAAAAPSVSPRARVPLGPVGHRAIASPPKHSAAAADMAPHVVGLSPRTTPREASAGEGAAKYGTTGATMLDARLLSSAAGRPTTVSGILTARPEKNVLPPPSPRTLLRRAQQGSAGLPRANTSPSRHSPSKLSPGGENHLGPLSPSHHHHHHHHRLAPTTTSHRASTAGGCPPMLNSTQQQQQQQQRRRGHHHHHHRRRRRRDHEGGPSLPTSTPASIDGGGDHDEYDSPAAAAAAAAVAVAGYDSGDGGGGANNNNSGGGGEGAGEAHGDPRGDYLEHDEGCACDSCCCDDEHSHSHHHHHHHHHHSHDRRRHHHRSRRLEPRGSEEPSSSPTLVDGHMHPIVGTWPSPYEGIANNDKLSRYPTVDQWPSQEERQEAEEYKKRVLAQRAAEKHQKGLASIVPPFVHPPDFVPTLQPSQQLRYPSSDEDREPFMSESRLLASAAAGNGSLGDVNGSRRGRSPRKAGSSDGDHHHRHHHRHGSSASPSRHCRHHHHHHDGHHRHAHKPHPPTAAAGSMGPARPGPAMTSLLTRSGAMVSTNHHAYDLNASYARVVSDVTGYVGNDSNSAQQYERQYLTGGKQHA